MGLFFSCFSVDKHMCKEEERLTSEEAHAKAAEAAQKSVLYKSHKVRNWSCPNSVAFNGIYVYCISKNKRVVVRNWKGNIMVDICEFYLKNDKQLPSRKGHGTQILEIAMDRFRENENGILVATDVAARGLDILGVRTIVHYRLPHSAEDNFQWFPLENSYVPEVLKRLSLARQIDKITRNESQVEKNWFNWNASSVELVIENYDSEEEQVNKHKQMKTNSTQSKKLRRLELFTPIKILGILRPHKISRDYAAGNAKIKELVPGIKG
ncbi:hypothetical protein JHK87_031111 [Glycine soja]|nr:hypothetical protein JHK87_031111 [Glycine soja]